MSLPGRFSIVPVAGAAPTEFIAIGEMRSVLRLDGDDESQDAYIKACLSAARRLIETKYRLSLIQRSFDLALDEPPCGPVLRVPISPLVSVTSFTYYDTADASHTLVQGTDFEVDTVSLPGRLFLKAGKSWPSELRPAHGIVIRFVAGWAPSGLPEVIVPAVQQTAAFLFEHRGEGGAEFELPPIVSELLGDYERPEA